MEDAICIAIGGVISVQPGQALLVIAFPRLRVCLATLLRYIFSGVKSQLPHKGVGPVRLKKSECAQNLTGRRPVCMGEFGLSVLFLACSAFAVDEALAQ